MREGGRKKRFDGGIEGGAEELVCSTAPTISTVKDEPKAKAENIDIGSGL